MQLNDLNKKNIYKVPERYFDDLPGKIQRRIEAEKAQPETGINVALWMRFLAPAVAAMLIAVIWIGSQKPVETGTADDYLTLLNEVSSENLVDYLELEGISSEEIMENVDFQHLEGSFEVSDGDYLEYLIEEDISNETIDAILDQYDLGV